MISIDTNILFYAINSASPHQQAASRFIENLSGNDNVVLSEFVLAEFYQLLRNPVILPHALNNNEACDVIASYRNHPRWQIVGFPPESQEIHNTLWQHIKSTPNLARRRFFDLRIAIILQSFGVKEFATTNTKDFQNLGFQKVWDPLAH